MARLTARGLWAPLLLTLLLSACSRPPQVYQQQSYVFGTLVNISIMGVSESTAEQATAAISQDFQQEHRDWHAWVPGALTRINDAIAAGKPTKVIPSLIPLIEKSKTLSDKSEGLFNPTIGRLLNLWGFQANEPPNGPVPSKESIAALVARHPSMDDVHLNGDMLSCDNPAVKLDFGAVGKGYAIDLAIKRLREFGIKDAIINAGGDLRAIGQHGNRPWRVGIRHPQGTGILAYLDVSGDESVFTSGNYERFREDHGVHYAHILDPRSGWPVQGITSVTVIADDGAKADASATALVVAGVKEWVSIAARLGLKEVMLVDEAGTVYMSPAMAERVHFEGDKPPKVVLHEIPAAG